MTGESVPGKPKRGRIEARLAVGAAMLSAACRRLVPALRGPRAPSAVAGRCLLAPGVRSFADQGGRAEEPRTFHPELLRCLVCPLSKKPLR